MVLYLLCAAFVLFPLVAPRKLVRVPLYSRDKH